MHVQTWTMCFRGRLSVVHAIFFFSTSLMFNQGKDHQVKLNWPFLSVVADVVVGMQRARSRYCMAFHLTFKHFPHSLLYLIGTVFIKLTLVGFSLRVQRVRTNITKRFIRYFTIMSPCGQGVWLVIINCGFISLTKQLIRLFLSICHILHFLLR